MWRSLSQRFLLAVTALLTSYLVYLLFANNSSAPVPTTTAPGSLGVADATISNFTFTQTKGDIVQWQVDAKHARLFDRDKRAVLDTVVVTLFGRQGKEFTVEGEEGTLETDTKNFVLANRSEPLVVRTASGYVIYTNHLAWQDETRQIRTSAPVRIVGNGLEVTGTGLLGYLDKEQFEVLQDVHVDVAPLS